MTDFRLRHAVVEDCAEILRLIKELAEYEKMLDEVHMTVEVLQRDGFGDSPVFKCIVAENLDSDGNVINGLVGYCLYFYLYSTWEGKCIHMEDLCVSPNFRRKGIGKSMIKMLAEVCVEEGCKRLQWAVLDWNTSAINFYKKTGAINLTEKEGWHCYRLDEDGIKAFVAE